jgi:hypothetical protein
MELYSYLLPIQGLLIYQKMDMGGWIKKSIPEQNLTMDWKLKYSVEIWDLDSMSTKRLCIVWLTRKRKRFRLVQHGDLQLLHYIRTQEGPQINPTMIKVRPRVVSGQRPGMSQPQAAPIAQGLQLPPNMTPQQVQQYNQRVEQQRKLLKMRQAPPVRLMEDEKDPSGGNCE